MDPATAGFLIMIKHIIIVGGGTAGWTSACLCLDRIPKNSDIKITLIEPKDIPIIGVGEATTNEFVSLIKGSYHLGDEEEFLRETGSTYKLGIRHTDWHTVGKHYDNPNGFQTFNRVNFPISSYDYMRVYHIAQNHMEHNIFIPNRAMQENKLYYIDVEMNNPFPEVLGYVPGKRMYDFGDHAYHLATWETVDYLRKKCLATGRINIVNDKVLDVIRDENDIVTKLKMEHSTIEGDFFIDCTGFKRTLIAHKNKFISFKNNLLLDTAIAFPEEYKEGEKIRSYTHAKAMKNGWMWESPTQQRMGRGYNFCSELTSEEEVLKELEQQLGYVPDVKIRVKYDSGHMERTWVKNVLSTGLSSSFLEPLEATSIHGTIKELKYFFDNYFHGYIDMRGEAIQNSYNETISNFWSDVRDFILWHYQNTRQDSEFWRLSSHKDRLSDKLKFNMEVWKQKLPRPDDYHNGRRDSMMGLGNVLIYQTAIGMKLLDPELARKELDYYQLNEVIQNDMDYFKRLSAYVVPRMMSADEYYKKVLNNPR